MSPTDEEPTGAPWTPSARQPKSPPKPPDRPTTGSAARVKVRLVDVRAKMPEQSHKGDAGFDLVSLETRTLRPRQTHAFITGLRVEIPPGYEGQVRPRSGLALKKGITVLNAPGTVDAGYRGDMKVILHNAGEQPQIINEGDRIAQLVIAKVANVTFEEADELSPSERGEGGFGSTGR